MAKFICDHPWTHFEVNNPNGDVTMCCDNSTVLGNVNQNTIEEIWNGEGYREIRRQMRDDGAHAICPHTCPVLNGGKGYQRLNWNAELTAEGPARANADLNDRELGDGLLELKSLPRWMRFTWSYACNLDCYHCYQREDATQKVKLTEAFLEQVRKLAPLFQVVFPFGGEPFLFKPVTRFMEEVALDPGCRYFLVTNATLLTDKTFELLQRLNIGLMAVSLDASNAASFDALRVRGRNADWDGVMANLRRLQQLKHEKNFIFTVSMTVNKVNHAEIENFVDLALDHDAEPILALVTNPYQTSQFQKEFLAFSAAEMATMRDQIARCLPKVRARGWQEGESALVTLRAHLAQHERGDNSVAYYMAKRTARQLYHHLPGPLQRLARKLIQGVRVRGLKAGCGDGAE